MPVVVAAAQRNLQVAVEARPRGAGPLVGMAESVRLTAD